LHHEQDLRGLNNLIWIILSQVHESKDQSC